MEDSSALPWWAWIGLPLAAVAFVLEFARVTLTWPIPVRAAWWAVVTAGIAAWHLGRHRSGERINRVVAALTVLAFATFTVGVATSAEWAAWH